MGESTNPSRRAVLGSVGAASALGVAAVLTDSGSPASARPRPLADQQVTGSFKVVDRRGGQRFLADTKKPPVIVEGKTYPAERRQGPDDASYLIFNDDNGNEKGGIVAHTTGAQVSLDYPNAQAVTLLAGASGQEGCAKLVMVQAPDASLPIEQVTEVPTRVELGWDSLKGSLLELSDSQGRPRIRLQVDADDHPRIQILDATGAVVAQLPE